MPGKQFWDFDAKSTIYERKNWQTNLYQNFNLLFAKTLLGRWKGKLQFGRKYLQIIYLTDDQCVECVCVCIYISQNLTVKKNKNLIRKWAKGIKRDVCKDDIQMANKHKKNWSIPLAIRKMPMKTTERYHYMCIRMTKTKRHLMLAKMCRNWIPHTLLVGM